jgi:hypothetical protein
MLRLYATTLAVVAIGCSGAPPLKEGPVSVSGKVVQGGKPVSNVVLWFHPLDKGHLQNVPVSADGGFTGELIGGNYSYYVAASSAPNSAAALKAIDPKYYEPNMERKISVEFGKELILALD